MQRPIPITVLTGFLGSGKTTLLKALLNHNEMAGTAIIVNEFGEIGIDDALIQAATEETVMLPSGCVCCAVRGDLVEALHNLNGRVTRGEIPNITRVVLETSGLADPAPIAHTLMTEEDLFSIFQLDGIVATFDAELGPAQLKQNFEPAKQLSIADRIVLTKTDRISKAETDAAETIIRALNKSAPIVRTVMGDAGPDLITGLAAFEPTATRTHVETWLATDAHTAAHPKTHAHAHAANAAHIPHDCHAPHCAHPDHDHSHHPNNDHHHHEHTHGIRSFAINFDEPLDAVKLSFTMELLRMTHGDKLLRVKGILNVEGEALPFVVHGVQHVFYPPTRLDAWPSQDRRSRLVFITKELPEEHVFKILGGMFQPTGQIREEDWIEKEF